ncbi:MAG: glycoside hydrolase family 127 protein [Planctomycetes bacterium]|nr:glycoside hydrolase family 127 protein [Planctomycetota bacterium]
MIPASPKTLLCLAALAFSGARAPAQSLAAPLEPVPFTQVELADPFLAPRMETCRTVVIPACLDQCERTHRIHNFAVAAGRVEGAHEGALYNDSDVYKVIEGAAYALARKRDAALEARIDAIIELIAAAQHEDGYLNTYVQLVKPAERWKDMAHGHELYCAGHLMEAAVAYTRATGKELLLEVARKFAERIDADFGPGKRLDPCGHPEIELALVELGRFTGEPRFAKLARFFVDQRGSTQGRTSFGEYAQDHRLVREQTEIVGHAVRAMYLYSGMADVAAYFRDETLLRPSFAIWRDLIETKTYVTGGIGSSAANEGFTKAYDLPNDTAYCETCASIGMLLWNHRLFLATGRSDVLDVVEKELYNGIPSGLALAGDRFFYGNPLASRGDHERVPWFDCSCCPTNLARTLPSVGQYVYATGPERLYVALFAQSRAEVELAGTKVRVRQTTRMPWEGHVALAIDPELPATFEVWVRVPAWAGGVTLVAPAVPAGTPVDASIFPREVRAQGSAWRVLKRAWKKGDVLTVDFPLDVKRVRPDPKVEANVGRVALQRGPIVYAFEGADHDGRARSLVLPANSVQIDAAWKPDLLGGVTVLTMKGERVRDSDPFTTITEPAPLVAIPYATWANRGKNEMVVWIPEDAARAERPGEGVRLARSSSKVLRASACFPNDTLAALEDGVLGKSSADESIPRFTFWPKQGTQWVELDTKDAKTYAGVAVQWFDDTGKGGCRAPKAWRALWKDGAEWKPVALASGSFGVAKDVPNEARFAPVTTRALRLEVELQDGASGGLLEWRVDEVAK